MENEGLYTAISVAFRKLTGAGQQLYVLILDCLLARKDISASGLNKWYKQQALQNKARIF